MKYGRKETVFPAPSMRDGDANGNVNGSQHLDIARFAFFLLTILSAARVRPDVSDAPRALHGFHMLHVLGDLSFC